MTHTVKTREWEVGKIVSGVLFHSLLSRERDSLILQRVKNVATAAASGEREEEVLPMSMTVWGPMGTWREGLDDRQTDK